ncbi:hypothetical protein OG824_31825 [Streptomyces prunicolor]|uniref:hypothetical protein n=1 Tax=Streptomyces prunicolor TaxID=67348 RepID=UPI002253AC3D|nr:hypothetical protein [Streptomyces prunicolor]MCX5239800.1 hypothetical protein [Streptomyces prunicolor]
MRHNTLILAACSAALLAVTACSSSSTPKPKAPASATAGDPVGYLYDVDHHRNAHADVQDLVHQLQTRCTDDVLGLEFAATNTAADMVDATHAHQDVYPVLAQLVAQLPQGSTKVACASRLSAAEKQLKAKRTTG